MYYYSGACFRQIDDARKSFIADKYTVIKLDADNVSDNLLDVLSRVEYIEFPACPLGDELTYFMFDNRVDIVTMLISMICIIIFFVAVKKFFDYV